MGAFTQQSYAPVAFDTGDARPRGRALLTATGRRRREEIWPREGHAKRIRRKDSGRGIPRWR